MIEGRAKEEKRKVRKKTENRWESKLQDSQFQICQRIHLTSQIPLLLYHLLMCKNPFEILNSRTLHLGKTTMLCKVRINMLELLFSFIQNSHRDHNFIFLLTLFKNVLSLYHIECFLSPLSKLFLSFSKNFYFFFL